MAPRTARADGMHEFAMSCTYGVLAGTVVGTALLAFTNQPGDNLQLIARGASLGLYAGILLGLYVVYGVSDDDEKGGEGAPAEEPPKEGAFLNPKYIPRLLVVPLTSPISGQLDGAAVAYTAYRF